MELDKIIWPDLRWDKNHLTPGSNNFFLTWYLKSSDLKTIGKSQKQLESLKFCSKLIEISCIESRDPNEIFFLLLDTTKLWFKLQMYKQKN